MIPRKEQARRALHTRQARSRGPRTRRTTPHTGHTHRINRDLPIQTATPTQRPLQIIPLDTRQTHRRTRTRRTRTHTIRAFTRRGVRVSCRWALTRNHTVDVGEEDGGGEVAYTGGAGGGGVYAGEAGGSAGDADGGEGGEAGGAGGQAGGEVEGEGGRAGFALGKAGAVQAGGLAGRALVGALVAVGVGWAGGDALVPG